MDSTLSELLLSRRLPTAREAAPCRIPAQDRLRSISPCLVLTGRSLPQKEFLCCS